MKESIISGKMNPGIEPVLNIWHWEIPFYLFVGGLAAGLIFFASLYTILGKDKQYKTINKASLLVPIILVVGLLALFLDLNHKLYFWRLYTTIRLDSPMSWGAWTLMLVTPLSFVWAFSYIREYFPKIKFTHPLIQNLEKIAISLRKPIAWIQVVFAVILGIYTGILLSAFNARPLWNTSILGPLFLVSGLSTGAALIMWMSKDKEEQHLFGKIDLILIGIELFLITHLFMGFLASTEVQIEAAKLFLGGAFTFQFWVIVVTLGLILPALLEIMKLKGIKIPVAIPALLILIGGLAFRVIMVIAGQISSY